MHTIIFAGKDLNLLFFQTLIISPEVPLSRMTKIWVVYPSLIMLSSFLLKKVQKKLNCKKSFVSDFQNLARGLTATAERRVPVLETVELTLNQPKSFAIFPKLFSKPTTGFSSNPRQKI